VPVVFLLVAAWLLYNTIATQTREAVVGLFLIALGLPFYYYFNWRNNAAPADPETEDLP
jgi:APA family basic amino acid/polyamine antiporter